MSLRQMARYGNKNGERFKTAEERRTVCKALIEHLQAGYSLGSFYVDPETLERYSKEYPDDFPPDEIDKAFSAQRRVWEGHALDQSAGKSPHAKSGTTALALKNICGWEDKRTIEAPPPDPLVGVNSDQKMLDMALKIAFILHQGLKVKGLTIEQPANGIRNDVESGSQATGDQVAGPSGSVR